MITAIMTAYKRPYTLEEQYTAIKNQTVPPKEIFLWNNCPEEGSQISFNKPDVKAISCNFNAKFHGRFALANIAKTKYVAIFDDDTIPGPRWFENCLKTDKESPGIFGTIGVICLEDSYTPYHKIGWHNGNVLTTEVDLVGHAWFFKKEYLKYMWIEEPYSWENGEDIHFSYMALKHGNVKTYVPPHPPTDKTLWGSIPKTGHEYGNDDSASWKKNDHTPIRNEIVRAYIKDGWKTVRKRS